MFSGMLYEKDAKCRSAKRYNHQKGFQRKMVAYAHVTKDNVLVEFHPKHIFTNYQSLFYIIGIV